MNIPLHKRVTVNRNRTTPTTRLFAFSDTIGFRTAWEINTPKHLTRMTLRGESGEKHFMSHPFRSAIPLEVQAKSPGPLHLLACRQFNQLFI